MSVAEVLLGEPLCTGRVVAAVGHRVPHGSVGLEILVEAVEHRSRALPVCGFRFGAFSDDLDAMQHAGHVFFDQALVGVEHDLGIYGRHLCGCRWCFGAGRQGREHWQYQCDQCHRAGQCIFGGDELDGSRLFRCGSGHGVGLWDSTPAFNMRQRFRAMRGNAVLASLIMRGRSRGIL